MNKFFVSALASVGLVAAAAASQAQDVSYQLLTTTAYTTPPGAPSNPGSNLFLNDIFLKDYPLASITYAVPTVIKFGDDTTSAEPTVVPGSSATWTNVPVSFNFVVDTGTDVTSGTPEDFTISGHINGSVGYNGLGSPYSTASVIYDSITDTDGNPFTVTSDPENSVKALEISTVINGETVDLWIDTNQSKAAPGESVAHTGFITALTTPEPGSVAMIVGMGVSGGLFLRRKRRA